MARLGSAYVAALVICHAGYALVIVGALQLGEDPGLGLGLVMLAFALVILSTIVASRARRRSDTKSADTHDEFRPR